MADIRSTSTHSFTKKKLLFLVNVDWFFLSHRLPIALAAMREGYEVHLAADITDRLDELRGYGLIVHPISIKRSGTRLASELRSFWQMVSVLKKIRPDIVHLVTIKPVVFGGIAARLTGVPSVLAAVSGLGFLFVTRGIKATLMRTLVKLLYQIALGKRNLQVIFQNPDDRGILMKLTGLSREKCVIVRGSGVDLAEYHVMPMPTGKPCLVLAARLLGHKGVREFVQAARIFQQRGVVARFCLVGGPDPDNPASITTQELDAWRQEQCVEVLGHRNDISNIFAQAHIVVLPSYYGEGLPKVLIEAAACGRAVITTDMPGCRDAIVPDVTGLLVPARNVQALVEAMQHLMEDAKLCEVMGQAGRALAEREFSIDKVIDAHLAVYRQLQSTA